MEAPGFDSPDVAVAAPKEPKELNEQSQHECRCGCHVRPGGAEQGRQVRHGAWGAHPRSQATGALVRLPVPQFAQWQNGDNNCNS